MSNYEGSQTDVGPKVVASPVIKLKDTVGKSYVTFDIKRLFGFVPKKMIIQKKRGMNNCFQLFAILTEKELKKEEKKNEDTKAEVGEVVNTK